MLPSDEESEFNTPYSVSFSYCSYIGCYYFDNCAIFVNSSTITRCPFCKGSNYAVEYRGVKSKEERGLEEVVRPIFFTKYHTSIESIGPSLCSFSICVKTSSNVSMFYLGGTKGD